MTEIVHSGDGGGGRHASQEASDNSESLRLRNDQPTVVEPLGEESGNGGVLDDDDDDEEVDIPAEWKKLEREGFTESASSIDDSQLKLRDTSQTFFDRLASYWQHRQRMKGKSVEVDPQGLLPQHQVVTHSNGIEIKQDDGTTVYKPEYRQQTIEGKPVRGQEDLYKAAEAAIPTFESIMAQIKKYQRETYDSNCQAQRQGPRSRKGQG